jgi:hypothetical protein
MIMAIDPALKGTTFGAALEAAERAEQAKREARDAERANPQVIPHARQMAQELRQQLNASNPTKEPTVPAPPVNGPDHQAKRADWVRMAQAPDPSPDLTDLNFDEDPPVTLETVAKLTPTQIKILKDGTDSSPFKIGSVGRAIGALLDLKMIEPTEKKGWWALTRAGKDAYQIHLAQEAAANDQVFKATESAINLDDPALLDDRTETTRWKQIAEDRLRKLNELNKTLDDMGKVADDLQSKLNAAVSGDEEYSQVIYQKLHDMGVTVEDIERIKASLDMDGSTFHSIAEYVTWLRLEREHLAQQLQDTTHSTDAVDEWYQLVVSPLVDLMLQYATEANREDILNNPDWIVRWASDTRQSLSNMDDIADERAKLIDEQASKIESLNRCIAAQQETINARMVMPGRASDALLAVQILDELCELIPEVEQYRENREAAVKAISTLKARRS